MEAMTQERRNKMQEILKKAREEGDLIGSNPSALLAAGPLAQLLVAVIALDAACEDPVGADEEDRPEIDHMMVRLLEMYTGEKL